MERLEEMERLEKLEDLALLSSDCGSVLEKLETDFTDVEEDDDRQRELRARVKKFTDVEEDDDAQGDDVENLEKVRGDSIRNAGGQDVDVGGDAGDVEKGGDHPADRKDGDADSEGEEEIEISAKDLSANRLTNTLRSHLRHVQKEEFDTMPENFRGLAIASSDIKTNSALITLSHLKVKVKNRYDFTKVAKEKVFSDIEEILEQDFDTKVIRATLAIEDGEGVKCHGHLAVETNKQLRWDSVRRKLVQRLVLFTHILAKKKSSNSKKNMYGEYRKYLINPVKNKSVDSSPYVYVADDISDDENASKKKSKKLDIKDFSEFVEKISKDKKIHDGEGIIEEVRTHHCDTQYWKELLKLLRQKGAEGTCDYIEAILSFGRPHIPFQLIWHDSVDFLQGDSRLTQKNLIKFPFRNVEELRQSWATPSKANNEQDKSELIKFWSDVNSWTQIQVMGGQRVDMKQESTFMVGGPAGDGKTSLIMGVLNQISHQTAKDPYKGVVIRLSGGPESFSKSFRFCKRYNTPICYDDWSLHEVEKLRVGDAKCLHMPSMGDAKVRVRSFHFQFCFQRNYCFYHSASGVSSSWRAIRHSHHLMGSRGRSLGVDFCQP